MTGKDKMSKVMGEWKEGKLRSSSGKLVKYPSGRKQAIAIGLSESGQSNPKNEKGGVTEIRKGKKRLGNRTEEKITLYSFFGGFLRKKDGSIFPPFPNVDMDWTDDKVRVEKLYNEAGLNYFDKKELQEISDVPGVLLFEIKSIEVPKGKWENKKSEALKSGYGDNWNEMLSDEVNYDFKDVKERAIHLDGEIVGKIELDEYIHIMKKGGKMGKGGDTWALFEQGTIHSKDLSKEEADEMLERHKRIFPDLEWYIEDIEGRFQSDEIIMAKGGSTPTEDKNPHGYYIYVTPYHTSFKPHIWVEGGWFQSKGLPESIAEQLRKNKQDYDKRLPFYSKVEVRPATEKQKKELMGKEGSMGTGGEITNEHKMVDLIIKYRLSIRQIPEQITHVWTYRKGDEKKEGAEVIERVVKEGMSLEKFEEGKIKLHWNESNGFRWEDGRVYRKSTKEVTIPKHAGWWMCKVSPNNTDSMDRWSYKTDNLSPTLKESIELCVSKIDKSFGGSMETGGELKNKFISVAPQGTVFVKVNSHRARHKVSSNNIPKLELYNFWGKGSAGQSINLIKESDYDKIKNIVGVSTPVKQLRSEGMIWRPKMGFGSKDFTPEQEKLYQEYQKANEKEMQKGGEIENKGIDLFEDYKNIPKNVQKILDKYENGFEDGDYDVLAKAKEELEKIGYTFEYYLDGLAYDLRKIGEMGKVEYAEKHHIGLMETGGGVGELQKGDKFFDNKKMKHGIVRRRFKPTKGSSLESEPYLIDITYDDGTKAMNMPVGERFIKTESFGGSMATGGEVLSKERLEEIISYLNESIKSPTTSESLKEVMKKKVSELQIKLTDLERKLEEEREEEIKKAQRNVTIPADSFWVSIDDKYANPMRTHLGSNNIKFKSRTIKGKYTVYVDSQELLDRVVAIYNMKRAKGKDKPVSPSDVSGKSEKGGKLWSGSATKKELVLRNKARRMGILKNDEEKLSESHLKTLEKESPSLKKRISDVRTIRKFKG